MESERDIFGENKRAEDQREDALRDGYHFDNLFDQNETESGDTIDPATGKAIKNDQSIQTTHGLHIDEAGKLVVLKEITEGADLTRKQRELQEMANKLLRSYGSDEMGTEPPKKDSDLKKRKAA